MKALDCDIIVGCTTLDDRIALIAQRILAAAPAQFSLAGLSMGGYVALEIMRQAPDRVVRLALLNTSARADTEDQVRRRKLLLAMSEVGQFKGVTPKLLPMLVAPTRLSDQTLLDTIQAMAERVGRQAFQRQQTAILHRIDSRPYLKDVRCPVDIIAGDLDQLTPVEIAQEIASLTPRSRLHVLAGCGHLSPLEMPQHVTDILEAWMQRS